MSALADVMTVTIYSKDSCIYCSAAKSLLNYKQIEYKELSVPNDISTETFKEMFPEVKTFPLIINTKGPNDMIIGGLNELQKYILAQELILQTLEI